MDSQVEEIKKKLDIVEVIGKFLPLRKRGRHYLANCPFHGEKTPSFTVSQELQIFKCFGCGKAGDIFEFIQEYEHVEFKDALEDLAKLAGIKLQKSPRLTQVESFKKRLIDLNYELSRFYHYILVSHSLGASALKYLEGRGITPKTIKLFRIGYSPPDSKLAINYLSKKGFTAKELVASGTFGVSRYRQGQYYDRFQDRLVFPLCDFRNRVLGFSGRVLPAEFRSGSRGASDAAKYINSPETEIYHKSQMLFGLNLAREAIKKQNKAIIVEGEFDMISPYQLGVENVVALKGTAFTNDQLQLLRRYTDTLVLGLDADFAGTAAARKSIELADSLQFDIQVLDLGTTYKDPDEAIKSDPEFFRAQLQQTIPVWDFIINTALKNYDPTSVKGKKDILNLVLPFLIKIGNSVTRSDYYHKLASLIGSEVSAIIDEANKLVSPTVSPVRPVSTSSKPREKDVVENKEGHLLSLIFSARDPVSLSHRINEKIIFTTPRFQKIFSVLINSPPEFAPTAFSASLPSELVPVFQELFLAGTYLNLESRQRVAEVNKTINQILQLEIKKELADLSLRIARAESQGQDDLVGTLEADYNTLLSRLSRIQSVKDSKL